MGQSELPEQLTMPISPTRAIEVRRAPRPAGYLHEKDIVEINLRAAGWATRSFMGQTPPSREGPCFVVGPGDEDAPADRRKLA